MKYDIDFEMKAPPNTYFVYVFVIGLFGGCKFRRTDGHGNNTWFQNPPNKGPGHGLIINTFPVPLNSDSLSTNTRDSKLKNVIKISKFFVVT